MEEIQSITADPTECKHINLTNNKKLWKSLINLKILLQIPSVQSRRFKSSIGWFWWTFDDYFNCKNPYSDLFWSATRTTTAVFLFYSPACVLCIVRCTLYNMYEDNWESMEHVNTVAVALYSALSFITVFGYKLPLVFIKGTVVGCREQVIKGTLLRGWVL